MLKITAFNETVSETLIEAPKDTREMSIILEKLINSVNDTLTGLIN